MREFKTSDFDFDLPPELIAQYPLKERSSSRLLHLNTKTGAVEHHTFRDLLNFINANDLLVFNDTRVIPARLFGVKESGGKIECLIERILSDKTCLAHIRASKSPRPTSQLIFADDFSMTVQGRREALYELKLNNDDRSLLELMKQHGHIPLPPYIDRIPETADLERYQTVFADKEGAVAAPTAGLHFDEWMLSALDEKKIATAYVTLHVGAGTFQPMRTEELHQHIMHYEYMEISSMTCEAIKQCKLRGGRVIAVGTTVVRCLETAAKSGEIIPFAGETNLFIRPGRPGFSFNCVEAIVTNFHLPKSTLLMLIAAFGGYDPVMNAYQAAINNEYRFFSYGDAMLITL